jgi:exopolyphosphatase/pppGpp-phosphohydrolase
MTLGRENILPTGLAVLTSLMTRLDIARMTVTARNNTDGFLYTLYKNQHE